jgi:predicted nucleotidyltransferase
MHNNTTKNINKIVDLLKQEKAIISIYLYGSILTNNFKPLKSDIDILIIVKDQNKPFIFLKKIKTLTNSIKRIKIDTNIVFLSEFKMRRHIYRPPSYFIGIKYRSQLLFGKDLIKTVQDNELTYDAIHKRLIDLAQSSRAVYINNKDQMFWSRKYVGWLRMVVLEILFLSGDLDLVFSSGLQKIKKKHKSLTFLDNLKNDDLGIAKINEIAEKLRVFVKKKIIK